MRILTIPTRTQGANQSVFTTLDGRRYRLDLRWNGRIQRWMVSVYTGAGDLVVGTKALVVGGDVFATCRYRDDVPRGILTLRDLSDLAVEASLDSLGVSHTLVFIPFEQAA